MRALKVSVIVALCGVINLLPMGCATPSTGPTIESRLTPGRILDDSLLTTAIQRAIQAETQRRRNQVNVSLIVLDGRVFIFGLVPDQATKDAISTIAADFRHTRSVHNELFIGAPQRAMNNRMDRSIINKAERQLSIDPRTRESALQIFVFDGTVYLMGIVPRAVGEAATDLVKYLDGVRTVVVLLDYLD